MSIKFERVEFVENSFRKKIKSEHMKCLVNGSSGQVPDKTKVTLPVEAVYKDNKSVKSLTLSITYI